MDTRYLNVDCILRSHSDLTDLVTFLKNDTFLLWNELSEKGGFIGLETNLVNSSDPEIDIVEFLRLFNSLPQRLSELLAGCEKKVFDIGFESGSEGDPFNTEIDALVVRKISEIGFSIKMRIYPIMEDVEQIA